MDAENADHVECVKNILPQFLIFLIYISCRENKRECKKNEISGNIW